MGDLICCTAGDGNMSPHIDALCKSLVNPSEIESHIEEDPYDFEQRIVDNKHSIVLCIIHAPPTERDISVALRNNLNSKCILIQVSGHGSLKISSEFNDKLASFFWPNNHAEGIGLLGIALNSKFGQLSQWKDDAESVRNFIEEYFRKHFEVEHQIAAFLLNKHFHDNEVDAKKAVLEVGVRKEIADLSFEELEVKMKNLASMGI